TFHDVAVGGVINRAAVLFVARVQVLPVHKVGHPIDHVSSEVGVASFTSQNAGRIITGRRTRHVLGVRPQDVVLNPDVLGVFQGDGDPTVPDLVVVEVLVLPDACTVFTVERRARTHGQAANVVDPVVSELKVQ